MNKLLHPPLDPETFARNAAAVADLLRALGNDRRLMIMCKLAEHGEMTVGDLASAIALRRHGWDVTVLERADPPRAAGAGIAVWPNALRALDALGVGADVRAAVDRELKRARC